MFFQKKKKPTHWPFWLALALVVKGVQFFWVILNPHYSDIPGTWAVFGGDAISYLQPIENLLEYGSYTPDDRMPGYGAIYLFFRLFLNKIEAVNAVVLMQYLLDALTVYLLALAAYQLFKSRFVFYGVYAVALLSFNASTYSSLFLTESFSVSATILLFYFLVQHQLTSQNKYLFWAGMSWAWLVFMRPVYLPIGALVVGLWGVQWILKKQSFGQMFRQSLLFLLPFLVLDGVWIVRNYPIHKRVVPLAPVFWYASSYESGFVNMLAFFQSFGGGFIAPASDLNWFGISRILMQTGVYLAGPPDTTVVLPAEIYTTKFNQDSLLQLRQDLKIAWSDTSTDSTLRNQYRAVVRRKFATYTQSIKEEKPFLYYVKAPLKHAVLFFDYENFWYSGGLFEVPPHAPALSGRKVYYAKYFTKLICKYLYYSILALGACGLFWLLKRRRWQMEYFIALATIYSILLFPMVLRMPEPRYFLPAYPFMIVAAVVAVWQFKLKIKQSV